MTKTRMDGNRVRTFLNAEVESLLATYQQFERLLPAPDSAGASHRPEDGRYVEALVRSYLKKLLPQSLEVASGFIMRPAVKTGKQGRERVGDKDAQSTQLDIIIFDAVNYPAFTRFEAAAIVPPEGVLAIISVKKHLRASDIKRECKALSDAARLCACLDARNVPIRGPFLSLIGIHAEGEPKNRSPGKWAFDQIKKAYDGDSVPTFDEVVGHVGTLDEFSVFKKRPVDPCTAATFIEVSHKENESHIGLQMILTGVLSAHFDESRNPRRRPGFSGFQPGRSHDGDLGSIEVKGLR